MSQLDREQVRQIGQLLRERQRVLRGEPIGYPRLAANPAAVRCHACQSRREREYAHPKVSSL